MNKVFEGVVISGVIKPGEVYIISEGDRDSRADGISVLYTIREDSEIIPALDMETRMVCGDIYEVLEFLGIHKISEDSYQVALICKDIEDNRTFMQGFYIHRILSFHERLTEARECYRVE
jgi:hypothetical protein